MKYFISQIILTYLINFSSMSCDRLIVPTIRHAHPGNPYVYGLVGVDHDLDFPEPMPVVGMYFLSLIILIIKILIL